ncbi:hypothetical protein M8J76_004611 [Diaphorina citri]|nr:hypothetical protein M8J76_004611 [Diaphorina citri]
MIDKNNDTPPSIQTYELDLLKFEKQSQHGKVSEILNGNFDQYLRDCVSENLAQWVVNNNVEEFNKALNEKNESEQLETLMIGISSLYAFIQENWTGPRKSKNSENQPSCIDIINVDDKTASTMLCVDSVEFSTIPRQPKLLLVAKFVLSGNYTKLSTHTWWLLRTLAIHQTLLDENSSHIYQQIESLATDLIQDKSSLLSNNPELKLQLQVEMFHIYLSYGVVSKSQQVIKEINGLSDISMSLKGALGKRTKWQTKNLAQLLLEVKFDNKTSSEPPLTLPSEDSSSKDPTQISDQNTSSSDNIITQSVPSDDKPGHISPSGEKPSHNFPHNIQLDDDTRLETITYEDETSIPSLSPAQQIVVYTNLLYAYRTQPKDNLKTEELRPYMDVLLGQEGLLYGVLYLRSKLEADHRRTVERSMLQLEELSTSLSKEQPACRERLEHFFLISIPSANTMEATLAGILVSLGDIKSALGIYETLRHWEEMILCYNLLQLRHLSVAVIRDQLALGETPKLYCLLGDATDEVEHYHKAWTLSGERSARAMKCLGMYYYKRQEYTQAIPYLQRSLTINSIQIDLWSRLGYAALQCEEFKDVACSAYNRYVSLEPDDFQVSGIGCNNINTIQIDIWSRQGYAALQCEEFKDVACSAYNRYVSLEPDDFQVSGIVCNNINTIQIDIWSRLGYAALQCEEFKDVACSAYNRYVSLEPDDFQVSGIVCNNINTIQIDIWSRLGYAALQCEEFKDVACSAYNRYVSLEPDDFQVSGIVCNNINTIQIDIWSRLGYAALQCEEFKDVACSAYNRYVSLEPDDFQGWNNLARAYLDRGEKTRAYNALVEAVRTSNMDNWKVIENLMRVAVDVGQFECALRSYSHLLDIKPKHFDGQVLAILVSAILENLSADGTDTISHARSLHTNALRLFGRLSSEILNECELWYLYAQLNQARENASCAQELRRTLKFVTHAHACCLRDENSSKTAAGRARIGEICRMLCDVTVELGKVAPPVLDRRQVLFSSKLTLRSSLVTLERNGEGEDKETRRVRECLSRVEALLSEN